MARLFTCGGETGAAEWNGAYNTSTSALSLDDTVQRTGDYSVRLRLASTTNDAGYLRQVFDANKTEIYGRFAIYLGSAISKDTCRLLRFYDDNFDMQLGLFYNPGTATFDLYSDTTTKISSGTIVIPAETWVVCEFRYVIGASGPFTLKINGTTSISYTSNTDTQGTANLRSVMFRNDNGTNLNDIEPLWLDDIAINDTEGIYENSWPGLGGVFWLDPTANGNQNDWTPSSGTVNYEMVDDIPPDNATTYNQALSTGSIDLFEIDDCPLYIDEINFVQVAYRAALVTSGYNELTDLVRVGTVNYGGTEHTIVPITPSFTYYLGTIHYLNPSTGSAWGTAEVNGIEAGIEITT